MAAAPEAIQTIRHWVDFAWPVTNAPGCAPGHDICCRDILVLGR